MAKVGSYVFLELALIDDAFLHALELAEDEAIYTKQNGCHAPVDSPTSLIHPGKIVPATVVAGLGHLSESRRTVATGRT